MKGSQTITHIIITNQIKRKLSLTSTLLYVVLLPKWKSWPQLRTIMVLGTVKGSSSVFPSLKRLELSVSFCSPNFSPRPNRKIRSKLTSNSLHSCLRNNHPKPTDTSTDSTRTNPPNTHPNSNALPKRKTKQTPE